MAHLIASRWTRASTSQRHTSGFAVHLFPDSDTAQTEIMHAAANKRMPAGLNLSPRFRLLLNLQDLPLSRSGTGRSTRAAVYPSLWHLLLAAPKPQTPNQSPGCWTFAPHEHSAVTPPPVLRHQRRQLRSGLLENGVADRDGGQSLQEVGSQASVESLDSLHWWSKGDG